MRADPDPRAGRRLAEADLIDVARLLTAYEAEAPDPASPLEQVAFGTSGHRGSAFTRTFNAAHVRAICEAICDVRAARGVDGPLFLGYDTHALSRPAFETAVEVFVAAGVALRIDARGGFTPTPAVSLAILEHNRDRVSGWADGVVITPSHNPPQDGGLKYNPPHGGPAEPAVTSIIERQANVRLAAAPRPRRSFALAVRSGSVTGHDFRGRFVAGLASVVDVEAIAAAGVRIGIDPLGGASADYWPLILERYGLAGEVVNPVIDPRFAFMPADHDGQIRMDCSSPYAMARLVELRSRFDVAFGNDPDADRHGVVTPSEGLLASNAYLTAAAAFLFAHRPQWAPELGLGKTVVTTELLARLARRLGRSSLETPVGFRWFVEGLSAGRLAFAGEESAGAVFRRRDGRLWVTEKDGFSLGLLAAEMLARTGEDPGGAYRRVAADVGQSFYARIDAPASPAQKARLQAVRPEDVKLVRVAGEPVLAVETTTAAGEPIGGVRVRTADGWFAARPSGTEPLYKLYTESFRSQEHLAALQDEAQTAIHRALGEG
ncbi:alpha-D-glucose phosphate-specific phosphoglucomutase [Phenylobacterium aquaticum]|uniref:alpha-D-glucose phosphate-specific phosphoglucomutase n=1 Tax=Phenylobacterium aquaticum TaxID=1763816 RepID=UPI001F5D614B|nr:alpha-D-glucose phosphate-specific phosphoglucomutase [Phenylobacterium aquaticum]MCI3130841.1 alpha-D-glucose phosphate-specific phosphoglucomutase [Phenylobacterium aquaticum]